MKMMLGTLLLATLVSSVVYAEGFQNFEQNSTEMGNSYAGNAAIKDASSGFFNPAALILFKTRQVSYSTVAIFDNASFHGSSTWRSNLMPINTPGYFYTQAGSARGGKTQYLPAFNEVIPFNNRFAIGLNAGIPFSFNSDYGDNSILRYDATQSRLYVVDITPSIAYLITPDWSAGIGADFDYAHANVDSIIGLPGSNFSGNNPTAFDSTSENKASKWGVGWHGGILYQYSPSTHFGLAYHSEVNFNMTGASELTGAITNISNASLTNENFNMKLKTPDSANLSIYHQLNPQWELLGSLVYTDWNKLNNFNLHNVMYVINGTPMAVNTQIPLNLHNSWYTAVGANYLINPHVTLRGGLAYDESPATAATSIRVVNANKIILGTGIQYNLNKMWSFDLGYQHWFAQNSNRNTLTTVANGTVNTAGQLKQNANLVGMQITWNIGMLGYHP